MKNLKKPAPKKVLAKKSVTKKPVAASANLKVRVAKKHPKKATATKSPSKGKTPTTSSTRKASHSKSNGSAGKRGPGRPKALIPTRNARVSVRFYEVVSDTAKRLGEGYTFVTTADAILAALGNPSLALSAVNAPGDTDVRTSVDVIDHASLLADHAGDTAPLSTSDEGSHYDMSEEEEPGEDLSEDDEDDLLGE